MRRQSKQLQYKDAVTAMLKLHNTWYLSHLSHHRTPGAGVMEHDWPLYENLVKSLNKPAGINKSFIDRDSASKFFVHVFMN